MSDTAALVQRLAERVQVLEDRLAILDLMAFYGPAVDAGDAEAVIKVWTEDGIYDVDKLKMVGHDEIIKMVGSDAHQGYIARGCGHVLEPGYVEIGGDTAVATCKSQLILKDEDSDGFTVARVTANRWELRKIDGEWKCTVRTSRVLDGRAEAVELLARGARGR